MARKLKPHVVDKVRSENGQVTLPVYFDRDEKDFFVEIADDEVVRAPSVDEVKKLAREKLVTAIAYSWEGFITVEVNDSWEEERSRHFGAPQTRTEGAQVGFQFGRMERSPHPTKPGKWVYRRHTKDFEAVALSTYDLERRARNQDLINYWSIESTAELPYAEETWAGLLALKAAVDSAQERLMAFINRDDVAAKLQLVGKQKLAPMLPEAITGKAKAKR